MGEEIFVKLRDCFTAGYTLPQYCIDNNIKRPLFVTEEKFLLFMWEIYVQFRYDKRMVATFSVLDATTGSIGFSVDALLGRMFYKNISELILSSFDAVILLTTKEVTIKGNVIPLDKLIWYFISKTYAEIPLLNFSQLHPEVHLIVTNLPVIRLNKNSTDPEKKLFQKNIHQLRGELYSKKEKIITPYDFLNYTNTEVLTLLKIPNAMTNLDGTTSLKDCTDTLIAIQNGKRMTAYQPKTFINKIYFMGTCSFFGIGAPFDKTIESYLQKLLNENNLPYCVENESQFFANRYQDIFYNLNNLKTKPGDIVFVFIQNLRPGTFPFVDVTNILDEFVDKAKFFADSSHVNELGYKLMAEKYFKFLTENDFFRDKEFNYPLPPVSPLRYPLVGRTGRLNFKYRQRGIRSLQRPA